MTQNLILKTTLISEYMYLYSAHYRASGSAKVIHAI